MLKRANRCVWRLLTAFAVADLVFSAVAIGATPASAYRDPRVVRAPALVDADGNRISDFLEAKLAARTFKTVGPPEEGIADLIVAFDYPPGRADIDGVVAAGGQVMGAWTDLVYAMHVALPVARLPALLRVPGVVLVEENAPLAATLYLSTRQTRARQVWPYWVEGDSSHNIAVVDTGLDDGHVDVGSKVVGWRDEVGPNAGARQIGYYATPIDIDEHGTHVAGIAAGLGIAAGTSSGVGSLPLTDALYFPSGAWTAWISRFPVDTTGAASNSTIVSKLKWGDTSSGWTVYLSIRNSAGATLATGSQASNGPQPLTVTYSSLAPGLLNYAYQNLPYKSKGGASPYWVQANPPMTAIGDGYDLMRGMAPGANLVGVKVLDDNGSSYSNIIIDGMSWIVANKFAYDIVVANLSLGGSSVSATLDTAMNNTVAAGIVVCAAAGNSRGTSTPYVYSPASASKAIAVAATSEEDRITSYSSYGNTGSSKPDVAAPGGSSVTGRSIASIDSNDADRTYNPSTGTYTVFGDAFPDDYSLKSGTSMASPHVAGAAALIAQAMGPWSWTEDQALRVKMYLGMTATETNKLAEAPPHPTLDRGAKDTSEGFGRINTDAAIEAMTMTCPIGSPVSATLGSQVTDKKCWARTIDLAAGTPCTISLANPAGGDYDLYLYRNTYTDDGTTSLGSIGDPIIAALSATAGAGAAETISFTPDASGTFYIVVKWVSGDGAFTLTATTVPTLSVSVSPATWPLGTLESGGNRATWTASTPAQGGYFAATNDGSGLEDISIQVGNSAAWTADVTPGADRFVMEWGQTQTQGAEPSWTAVTQSGVALVDDLAKDGSFAFDLRFRAPTSSAEASEQTVVVTVVAQP